MQKFKIGDEVVFKSGGPEMVVRAYEPTDGEEVTCQWFDKEHNLQEKSFHQDTLKLWMPPPPLISYNKRGLP